MSSLVNEFIINPVLRQARRFSEISRTTLTGSGDKPELPQPEAVTVIDNIGTDQLDQLDQSGPRRQQQQHYHNADNAPLIGRSLTCPEPFDPRPLISSTQETRVEQTMTSPMTPTVDDGSPRDHLGFPISPRRGILIPEDDGMKELRSRIQAIHAQNLSQDEKAKLMHHLLLEGYNASRVGLSPSVLEDMPSPASQTREEATPQGTLDSLKFWPGQLGESIEPLTFQLTDLDLAPTYAPIRHHKSQSGVNTPSVAAESGPLELVQPPLGCQHYERNVKLQCETCSKWYPCRLCHDSEEDHKLPRFQTRHMLCMLCGTPQKASEVCVSCGELSAQYYCNICKLWENRQSKPIYHCYDCGICRRGLGLGKDYVHCKTCCACIPTSIETSHKCIERSTDCNCPICGEYMFTSPKPVVFMTCGHSIHKRCYDQHMRVSYKCPICNKSLANMETQFRNLDVAIQGQPMPSEFRDTKAIVLCNDCSGRSTVPYHWLGLKCGICLSYNTVELQILGGQIQQLQAVMSAHEPAAVTQTAATPEPPATAPATRERDSSITMGRRRHSSRGLEFQRRASELIAGSYPPVNTRLGAGFRQIESDTESEDGILGFWGASLANGGSELDDESEDGLEDEDDEDDDDDDDDDDDEEEEEDELILIGHR